MNKSAAHGIDKAVDSIQRRLTDYACGLTYENLTPEAIHAAKVRIIGLTEDFLGAGRVSAILERLWRREDIQNAAAFVLA